MDETEVKLHRSLTNQAPNSEQIELIEQIREKAKELGSTIVANSVHSRERSLAITHLEETVMWAVKGILLNEY